MRRYCNWRIEIAMTVNNVGIAIEMKMEQAGFEPATTWLWAERTYQTVLLFRELTPGIGVEFKYGFPPFGLMWWFVWISVLKWEKWLLNPICQTRWRTKFPFFNHPGIVNRTCLDTERCSVDICVAISAWWSLQNTVDLLEPSWHHWSPPLNLPSRRSCLYSW